MRIDTQMVVPRASQHRSRDGIGARISIARENHFEASSPARQNRKDAGLHRLSSQSAPDTIAPRYRAAISAYLANQPTAMERLGVELVGIDEFA